MPVPNDLLRAARERLPSQRLPNTGMGRAELAEAVNSWLWETTRERYDLDARAIARYERGAVRWPGAQYRAALRHVLGVSDDHQLGFAPSDVEARSRRTCRCTVAPQTRGDLGRVIVPNEPRGVDLPDDPGQLVSQAAGRARLFIQFAERNTVGRESVDQYADDVRRVATLSQDRPFPTLLHDLVSLQSDGFQLIEGRSKPREATDLYFLVSLVSSFMAKASHDLGTPHDALTQARAAGLAAEMAGHNGLLAWVYGLRSLGCYWAGRHLEAVKFAQQGAAVAHSRGSASVWLASSEARALGALNRMDEAQAALDRAAELREAMAPDELDEFGGLCRFSDSTQAYYTADVLAWGDGAWAAKTESAATAALTALAGASVEERGGFGNEQGARCALAIARLLHGDIEGAMDALKPVLEIETRLRQNGIVLSVDRVRRVLRESPGRTSRHGVELDEAMESFTTRRLLLPNQPHRADR